MALVAGIGAGLFVLILFGVLSLVGCYLASPSKRGPCVAARLERTGCVRRSRVRTWPQPRTPCAG